MTSSYQYTPYIWPMVVGVGLSTILGIYSWRHRSVPGATGLALIEVFWVPKLLASALELAARDFPTKVFWFQIEYSCLLPVLTACLVFALEYAGLETWFNRRAFTLIAISVLISAPLHFTNNLHHLIWTDLWMDGKIQYHSGVLNYVLGGFGVLLTIVTLSVFFGLFMQSPLHRWPAGLIFFNMLVVPGVWFLDAGGLNPIKPLELADVVSNVSSAVYFVVLFRLRLFNVLPVARNHAIEQMREGMLVLDAETRISDINEAAQKLLCVTRSKVIGCDIVQALRAFPDLLKLVRDPVAVDGEVSIGDTNPRWYRVNLSPLVHRNGLRLGQILLFDEITDSKKAQGQLLDHQRRVATLEERERLARELHDGVCQMLAAAHLQAEAASEFLSRGDMCSAKTCLNHLAKVTQKAKESIREYLLGVMRGVDVEQSLFFALRQYIQRYSRKYGIHTDLVAPPELEEKGLDSKVEVQLQPIIIEALRNIRKHAGARSAQVIFAFCDGQVQVTIKDDGRGFDPLNLGENQGFGLRSMRGRAESVGVRFDLNSSPGKGTKVFLQVPWRKEKP